MSRARDLSRFSGDLTASSSLSVPLTITGATGQTANLLELKNSSGSVVSKINGNGLFASPGSIIQTVVKRTDSHLSYTTGTSASGVEFTDLRVSITPKYANSMILVIFQMHGEGASTHDYTMKIWKNGVVPDGTYAGYNTTSGNLVYSGFAQPLPYEGDYNSTPHTQTMHYHDFPNTTSTITYAPGVQDSYGTSRVYYVNRTVGSPQNGYETGVSMTIAMEIAQ